MKMKLFFMLFLGCLTMLSGASVIKTLSYFTDISKVPDNIVTVGNIQIELKEPNWESSEAAEMLPLESVKKDPLILNTGSVPAYVFLQVSIPVKSIRTIDEIGRKTETVPTELFTFQADSENWELIDTQKHAEVMQYVYGYTKVLNPGEQTTALFETVTSVNYLEGELDQDAEYVIDIQAKAIQSQLAAERLPMAQIYDFLAETS